MNEFLWKAEELTASLKEYGQVKLDQAKLEIAAKSSQVASNLVARGMALIAVVFLLLFLSAAAAYALGSLWNSIALGFLAVAGFYLILALLIWNVRDSMIRMPMMNSILSQLTKKDDDDQK